MALLWAVSVEVIWSCLKFPSMSCPAIDNSSRVASAVRPHVVKSLQMQFRGLADWKTARKPTSVFRIVHWVPVVGSSRLGFQRVHKLFSILNSWTLHAGMCQSVCDRPVAVEVPKPISSLWQCGPTGRQSLQLWDVLGPLEGPWASLRQQRGGAPLHIA